MTIDFESVMAQFDELEAQQKREVESGSGIGNFAASVAEGASQAIFDVFPEQLARATRELTVGQPDPGEQREGFSGILDRFIEEQKKDRKETWFTDSTTRDQKFIGDFTYGELENAVPQVGNSLAGLGAVAGTLATGGGAAPLAVAAIAGTAPMYAASKDQFVDDVLNQAKSEGFEASPEKWDQVRNLLQSDARSYALWEAAPELASNVFTAGIGKLLTTPASAMAKAYPSLRSGLAKTMIQKGVAIPSMAKAALAGTAQFGQELTTENITSMGQQPILFDYGLSDQEAISFVQASKENFAPTLVMSIVTGGAGALVRHKDKVRKEFENKIEEFDKRFDEMGDQIQMVSDDQLGDLFRLSRGKFATRLDKRSLDQYESIIGEIDRRGLRSEVDKPVETETVIEDTGEQLLLGMREQPEQLGYFERDFFNQNIDDDFTRQAMDRGEGTVREMTPQEYLEMSTDLVGFEDFNIEDGTAVNSETKTKVQLIEPETVKYMVDEFKAGNQKSMPTLNFREDGYATQDGWHRAMAAHMLGQDTISVAMTGDPRNLREKSDPLSRDLVTVLNNAFDNPLSPGEMIVRAWTQEKMGKMPSEVTQDDINSIGKTEVLKMIQETRKPTKEGSELFQRIKEESRQLFESRKQQQKELNESRGKPTPEAQAETSTQLPTPPDETILESDPVQKPRQDMEAYAKRIAQEPYDERPYKEKLDEVNKKIKEIRKVRSEAALKKKRIDKNVEELQKAEDYLQSKLDAGNAKPKTIEKARKKVEKLKRRELDKESADRRFNALDDRLNQLFQRRKRIQEIEENKLPIETRGTDVPTAPQRPEETKEQIISEFRETRQPREKKKKIDDFSMPFIPELTQTGPSESKIATRQGRVEKTRSKNEVDLEFNLRKMRDQTLLNDDGTIDTTIKQGKQLNDKIEFLKKAVEAESGIDKVREIEGKAKKWIVSNSVERQVNDLANRMEKEAEIDDTTFNNDGGPEMMMSIGSPESGWRKAPPEEPTPFEIDDDVVWSNEDFDMPAKVVGEAEEGPDGNLYQKIKYEQDGQEVEGFAPLSQLKKPQAKKKVKPRERKFKTGPIDVNETSAFLEKKEQDEQNPFKFSQRVLPEDQVDQEATATGILKKIQEVMELKLRKLPGSVNKKRARKKLGSIAGFYDPSSGDVVYKPDEITVAIHEMMHYFSDIQKAGKGDNSYMDYANQLVNLLNPDSIIAWAKSYKLEIPETGNIYEQAAKEPRLVEEGFAEFGRLYALNSEKITELLDSHADWYGEGSFVEFMRNEYPLMLQELDSIGNMMASYKQNNQQNFRTQQEIRDKDSGNLNEITNWQLSTYDKLVRGIWEERQAIFSTFNKAADERFDYYTQKVHTLRERIDRYKKEGKDTKELELNLLTAEKMQKLWDKTYMKGFRRKLEDQSASLNGVESMGMRQIKTTGLIDYNGNKVKKAISFTDLMLKAPDQSVKGREKYADEIVQYGIARRVVHEINQDNKSQIMKALDFNIDEVRKLDEDAPARIYDRIAIDFRAGKLPDTAEGMADYLKEKYLEEISDHPKFDAEKFDKVPFGRISLNLYSATKRMDRQKVSGAGFDLTTDYVKAVNTINRLGNRPEILDGIEVLEAWGRGILDYAHDGGRLPTKDYQRIVEHSTMEDGSSAYVSFMRVLEDQPGSGDWEQTFESLTNTKSIAKSKKLMQKLAGSSQRIQNPLVSTMKNLVSTLYEVENNEMRRYFAQILEDEEMNAETAGLSDDDLINEEGQKPRLSYGRNRYEDPYIKSSVMGVKVDEPGKNVITVYTKDGPRYYKVNEDIYDAMIAQKAFIPEGPAKIIHSMAQLVRNTVTIWPSFLNRNQWRDSIMRTVVTRFGGNVASDFKKTYVRGVQESMRQTPFLDNLVAEDPQYAEVIDNMQSVGADITFESFNSIEKYEDTIKDIIEGGASKTHAFKSLEGVYDFMRWFNKIREQSERTARASEYEAAYNHGIENLGMSHREASKFAANESRSLLDFSRSGKWVRPLMYYIPFLNSTIQGMYVTYDRSGVRDMAEAYLKDGRMPTKKEMARFGTFMHRLSLATLPITVIAKTANIMAGTEDDLEREPAYIRYLFWNFPLPDFVREATGYRWLSIPKPYDLGLYSAWVEFTADTLRGRDTKVSELAKLTASTITPDITTPIVKVAIGLNANYDSFRQRYIVPPNEAKLDLRLRKNRDRASNLGKILSSATGYDPRMLDFVTRELFGYPGRFAMDAFDLVGGREDKNVTGTGLLLNNFMPIAAGMARYPTAFQQTKLKELMDVADKYGYTSDSQYRSIMKMARTKYDNIRNPELFDSLAEKIDKRAEKLTKQFQKRGERKVKREERKRK